jgi:hypothetical protein
VRVAPVSCGGGASMGSTGIMDGLNRAHPLACRFVYFIFIFLMDLPVSICSLIYPIVEIDADWLPTSKNHFCLPRKILTAVVSFD